MWRPSQYEQGAGAVTKGSCPRDCKRVAAPDARIDTGGINAPCCAGPRRNDTGPLSLPRNAPKVIPPRSLDSRMIHLLSITRWNRGYRRVLAGIRPSVSELVISRRDKRIVSECFKTPHEFPGVPKGIKMAEPTGLEPCKERNAALARVSCDLF